MATPSGYTLWLTGFPGLNHLGGCRITADNGTEFAGAFAAFCQEHNIRIINTRPYHPQGESDPITLLPPNHLL